jgi:hypothetical protein
MMNSDQRDQSVSFASVSGKSHSLSCIHEMVRLRTERGVSSHLAVSAKSNGSQFVTNNPGFA